MTRARETSFTKWCYTVKFVFLSPLILRDPGADRGGKGKSKRAKENGDEEEKSLNHSTKMKMYRKSFGISAAKYAEPFAGIVTAAYFQVCEIFLKMSSPIHLIK